MTTPAFVPQRRQLLRGLGLGEEVPAEGRVSVNAGFLKFLIGEFTRLIPFDPVFYEATYPDVAAALASGGLLSSHAHFIESGYRENRLPRAPSFDAGFYLALYPELQSLAERYGPAVLLRHYIEHGRWEGRVATPHEQADAQRWRGMVEMAAPSLAHRTIQGALVRAFRPPSIAPPPLGFRGGPVLGSHPLDTMLRHRRRGTPVDSVPEDGPIGGVLGGDFVYGGVCHQHFGHVMSETLHRILPARQFFACRRLLFVDELTGAPPSGFDSLGSSQQQALALLDVAPEEVIVLHDDRVVERLHIAQQGAELSGAPHDDYLDMLAAFTGKRLDALHDRGAPQAVVPGPLVYVSRSNIPDRGVLLGERYLERQLALEGWTVFHPEAHSLAEQMQAYYRAEILLFAAGSSCHGAELFGRKQLRRCFVLPRGHTPASYYRDVLEPRCVHYETLPEAHLLGGIVMDPETGEPLRQWGVSVLDLPSLADALQARGLASLPYLSGEVYRREAVADLDAYIRVLTTTCPQGILLQSAAEIQAFADRARALLS
jgi:hypothetical protein